MRNLNETVQQLKTRREEGLPVIDITWKPHSNADYEIDVVEVYIGFSGIEAKEGEAVACLWQNVASIPAAVFTEEGVTAVDDQGGLPLEVVESIGVYGFPFKFWNAGRNTEGDIALHYSFYPREVPKDYRFRPYFDFRTERFGATGAGNTTLLSPGGVTISPAKGSDLSAEMQKYKVYINWDFSLMPEDSWGAAVTGENNHSFIGTVYDYQFNMYAMGRLKTVRSDDGRFGIYWLNEPLPDKERVIRDIPRILTAMSEQFEDPAATYNVFFRKDPFDKSNGATAFRNGFIYGYSDAMPLNWDLAIDIFAHEVVHTWPKLKDRSGNEGESYWYHEGTAEWYNIKILYNLGITDMDFVAQQLSWRSIEYYSNDYREVPDTEAFKDAWQHRHAQWLPYGRGFFYLQEVNRRMKEVSGGAKCLDDLVLRQLRQERATGEKLTIEDWCDIIREELGEDDVKFFREVQQGRMIEPDDRWFDGRFVHEWGECYEPVRGTRAETVVWKVREPSGSPKEIR